MQVPWGRAAEQAGTGEETLYRSRSPKGKPTFQDLAGGAEVGRDAAVGGAGESGAWLRLGW